MLACQYDIGPLQELCDSMLSRSYTDSKDAVLRCLPDYLLAIQITIPNLKFRTQILSSISFYFVNIVELSDSGFHDLTGDQLVLLLDEVAVPEELILQAAITWLSRDASRHSEAPRVFRQVRLPLLPAAVMRDLRATCLGVVDIAKEAFLQAYYCEALRFHLGKLTGAGDEIKFFLDNAQDIFAQTALQPNLNRFFSRFRYKAVTRCASMGVTRSLNGNKTDALSFTVSKKAMFHGFSLGPFIDDTKMLKHCTIYLFDGGDTKGPVLASREYKAVLFENTHFDEFGGPILLYSSPVALTPGKTYTMAVAWPVSNGSVKSGKDFKSQLNLGDVVINLMGASFGGPAPLNASNGSSVSIGIFPSMFFSL